MLFGWLAILDDISNNLLEYITIVLVVFSIYYILPIKNTKYMSIADPLFIAFVYSFFAISIPIYMVIEGWVAFNEYTIAIFSSEIALILGYMLCLPKSDNIVVNVDNVKDKRRDYFFNIFFSLYVLVEIWFYATYGIPMLSMSSHVAAGLVNGYYDKITALMPCVITFGIIDKFFRKKIMSGFFMLSVLGVIGILSGSKSGLLGIVVGLFFYQMYARKFLLNIKFNFTRAYFILMIFAVLGALLIIILNTFFSSNIDNEENVAWLKLIQRFAGSGDMYAFALWGNTFEYLYNNNYYYNLMIEPLAQLFRVIPRERDFLTLAHQATGFGVSLDNASLPNVRHNIWGVISFGTFGGCIFSFCLGATIAYICRKVYYKIINIDMFGFLMYIAVYQCIIRAMAEPMYALDGILVSVPFLYIIILLCRFLANLSWK